MGKELVAARPLPAGHVLGDSDLIAKSPADGGLPPYELDALRGRTLARQLDADEDVTHEQLVPVAEPVAARDR
jgi:sialic acid synthase SpsE